MVMAVIRKTYGYGKKADDMTMTQLAEMTSLSRPHVSETVKELEAKGVFLIRDGQYGKVIALQKVFKKWNFDRRPDSGQSQNGTRPELGTAPSQNGNNGVPKREMSRPESGHTIDNPKRQLQKTIPKDSSAAPSAAAAAMPEAAPTAATWKAYAAAYEARYGIAPKSNATTNTQTLNLIKRIGADEAPLVAAWYVQHNDAYYVRRGHVIGALLADCEKLRTEWATNRRSSATAARQADRTQAAGQVWGQLMEEGCTHEP